MTDDDLHNARQPYNHDRAAGAVKDMAEKFKALHIEPISFIDQDQIQVTAPNGFGRGILHLEGKGMAQVMRAQR